MKETTWFHENYTPTLEEYMVLGLETSGYGEVIATCFIGMGDVATKDAFEWLNSDPKILQASKILARLLNDIASHKVHYSTNNIH